MQAEANVDAAKPLMIIVPRARPNLYTSLHRAFDRSKRLSMAVPLVDKKRHRQHKALCDCRVVTAITKMPIAPG